MSTKRITVYCGSSYGRDEQVIADIKELGRLLGKQGAHVLYGGGLYGHLEDLMIAVGEAGGTMDAIISPAYYDENEIYPAHVNVIRSPDDETRVQQLLDSDAYIVTPGGDGTLAEAMFSHNRNLSALFQDRAQKPVIFMDTNGFYEHVRAHFNHMKETGYSNDKRQQQLYFEDTPQKVVRRLRRAL